MKSMSQETFPVYLVESRKFLTKEEAIAFAGTMAGLMKEDVRIDVVNVPVSLDRVSMMTVNRGDCPIEGPY